MGFYDREYYRDDDGGRWEDWLTGRVTVGLIAVTGAIYVLQLLTRHSGSGGDELFRIGGLSASRVMSGEVWRLFTASFLHDPGNIFPILLNMVLLYLFGFPVEGARGSKEFLGFYLVAATVSQIGYFAAQVAGLAGVGVSGSSGALYASLVLFLCLFPRTQLPIVPLPLWPLVAVFLALDALSLLAQVKTPSTGNPALDLSGAAFGLAYYRFDWRVTNWLPSFRGRFARRSRPAKPSLRVVPREYDEQDTPEPQPVAAAAGKGGQGGVDEQLEAKLDNVLEKVARLGKGSLTPEENQILLRASEIYKRRRGS